MIYYIHSDFTSFIRNPKIKKLNEEYAGRSFINKGLNLMLNDIKKLFGKSFILPAYNYDFGKTRIYNVVKDQSQTGLFTEFCRKKNFFFRSYTPMFSSISMNKNLIKKNIKSEINPFDRSSEWENLYNKKGKIVNYGVSFTPTYIHYIENKSRMINYRKEKRFDGKIVLPNKKRQKISLIFSVRPKNLNISYDTKKVRKDLKKEGILKSYNINNNFYYEITDAKDFCDFAINKIRIDEYYFLDKKTVHNLKQKLK